MLSILLLRLKARRLLVLELRLLKAGRLRLEAGGLRLLERRILRLLLLLLELLLRGLLGRISCRLRLQSTGRVAGILLLERLLVSCRLLAEWRLLAVLLLLLRLSILRRTSAGAVAAAEKGVGAGEHGGGDNSARRITSKSKASRMKSHKVTRCNESCRVSRSSACSSSTEHGHGSSRSGPSFLRASRTNTSSPSRSRAFISLTSISPVDTHVTISSINKATAYVEDIDVLLNIRV